MTTFDAESIVQPRFATYDDNSSAVIVVDQSAIQRMYMTMNTAQIQIQGQPLRTDPLERAAHCSNYHLSDTVFKAATLHCILFSKPFEVL